MTGEQRKPERERVAMTQNTLFMAGGNLSCRDDNTATLPVPLLRSTLVLFSSHAYFTSAHSFAMKEKLGYFFSYHQNTRNSTRLIFLTRKRRKKPGPVCVCLGVYLCARARARVCVCMCISACERVSASMTHSETSDGLKGICGLSPRLFVLGP